MEKALDRLAKSGFPMDALSIVVREADSVTSEGRHSDHGHSLVGITHFNARLQHLNLPEMGSTLALGPDVKTLFESSSLQQPRSTAGVLERLGVAPESAQLYSRHLTNGAYLVTLRGDHQDLTPAASTLGEYGMRDWGIYDVRRS